MAGGGKPNPLLQKYEMQAEQRAKVRYQAMLDVENEIGLIAYVLACDDQFDLTPDQAGDIVHGFLGAKRGVASAIASDEDEHLVYTKYDLARRLKQTLGPENWQKYRYLFPLLKEYW